MPLVENHESSRVVCAWLSPNGSWQNSPSQEHSYAEIPLSSELSVFLSVWRRTPVSACCVCMRACANMCVLCTPGLMCERE